jgi:phenylalanyl-tRNA synthetase beta chain
MKFTLSWLKDHLETEADLATIARELTAIGLEVEEIADRAADLGPFIVARVVEAKPHPNADKLRVCLVDTGKEQLQVVCGAPNAHTGMKGVFAAAGTTIPRTGLLLKKTEIRGVASNGMLCSAYEMGLSEDHEGIIELAEDAPVGKPFAAALGLDDPVIDVAITPNRAEALGVRGIARDLAARRVGALKPRSVAPVPGAFAAPISVTLDDRIACPLFVGRLIRGVKNGPSPDWLRRRLEAIGLRPISALVDITNYMTIDVARPLHVFDAAKVRGNLTVRLSRAGERLAALNGKEYTLEDGMTVIADGSGVISLGGVIGGESTSVSGDTQDVFVEAALFDPLRTAQTGRKLGINSDARYRFERGVDPLAVTHGMEAATRLILDLCGGAASALAIAGEAPDNRKIVRFRPARSLTLGGVAVPEGEAKRILEDLGFAVMIEQPAWQVTSPSFRHDIEGEADIVEEVLRIHGFEHIPATPLPPLAPMPRLAVTPAQRMTGLVRRLLATRGFHEAVTWSFMPADLARRFGGGAPELALANPIASDLDQMRPTPLPNLIAAAQRNRDRGQEDVALAEIGPGFAGDRPEGQLALAAGVRIGMARPRQWREPARAVDAFDAKADVLAVLASFGIAAESVQLAEEAPDWYHPGQSSLVKLGPKNVLARFGALHPEVLALYGVDAPAVGFEIFLDAIPLPRAKAGRARPMLKAQPFQPVVRDFAFLVDRGVAADALLRAARRADKALVTEVRLFDLYEGKGLPEGKKSIAITATLQPTERTLTDAEIDAVAAKIVAAVAEATGGSLRA